MDILVTAGNTQAPIDRVRCITNIFTGRTGAAIALEAYRRGHHVTLITSQPKIIDAADLDPLRWRCLPYRTFDDLETRMRENIQGETLDAVVHCAAVADYLPAGIYSSAPGSEFDPTSLKWQGDQPMLDRSAGKVKSDEPELWLRLVRAPKLIDRIRTDWHHRSLLVKFKLEVGLNDDELLAIAEKSRVHSSADWMVANTLETATESALLGNEHGYRKVKRSELASRLLDVLEQREI
jgi:phosphopantothenate---cysteine ligase (CTP)